MGGLMPSAAARQGPSCGEYAIFILKKKWGKLRLKASVIFWERLYKLWNQAIQREVTRFYHYPILSDH
jgi:hypothetical protein